MKRNILVLSLLSIFALAACKKVSTEEPTPTLDVEEKNSVLIAKHTWTGCGPCGGWGFTTFENLTASNPEHVLVSFTRGNLGGYGNQAIYDFIQNTFDIPGATPTFHNNLDEALSVSQAQQQMDDDGVIANSNYEWRMEDDKIILSTTTKFFQDINGVFTLAPYLVLDGIIANQSGHPDGANTEHHRVAVDIAKPAAVASPDFAGYTIADGQVKAGYTVNLEFEVDADASWDPNNVSFALMILQSNGDGTYKLINTFGK
ncbi:MAG: hypothetical protein P8P74_04135 [Crocinitomicaceae bacterium]|nr:hypothetical protein [Crocinitomicaceae bacterium]